MEATQIRQRELGDRHLAERGDQSLVDQPAIQPDRVERELARGEFVLVLLKPRGGDGTEGRHVWVSVDEGISVDARAGG
ncbi:MAG: hypothetical protein K0V04_36420 [Deltaproteobacteria bacterium]|nr:hypothetical protein [Deltaproteobacteria bacterium]